MADTSISLSTEEQDKSRWQRFRESDFFFAFKHSPVAIVSFAVVTFLVLTAVFAPWVAPTNPFGKFPDGHR